MYWSHCPQTRVLQLSSIDLLATEATFRKYVINHYRNGLKISIARVGHNSHLNGSWLILQLPVLFLRPVAPVICLIMQRPVMVGYLIKINANACRNWCNRYNYYYSKKSGRSCPVYRLIRPGLIPALVPLGKGGNLLNKDYLIFWRLCPRVNVRIQNLIISTVLLLVIQTSKNDRITSCITNMRP